MRSIIILSVSTLLLIASCKKNISEEPLASEPLPGGLAIESGSFTPISSTGGTYTTQTNLLSIAAITGGDVVTQVSDGTVTAQLVSDFYKVDSDPFNWDGSWGSVPNVELQQPHALYNLGTDPASISLSPSVTTFGVEVFWDGMHAFKVEFWRGNNLLGSVTRSFTPDPNTMGTALLFAASDMSGIDHIKFIPQGPSAFGFAIAQMRYSIAAPQVKKVHVDVLPGSCINPYQVKAQGVLPVAITGAADLNVNDIDISTIRLNGIAPAQWSIEKAAAPYAKVNDCSCTNSGNDNLNDLSLKFNRAALSTTMGNPSDGSQVVLVLTGKLKNGMDISGKDCVLVKK